MDAALRELVDERAIAQVLIGYARALDEMDLPAIRALFTEDCTVSYGPEPRLNHRGAAEVAAALARVWRFEATSHHVSNITVRFEGPDTARSDCLVIAWHRLPGGEETIVYGRYRDLLVRTAGGWRIAERRMEMNGGNAAFRVGLHPAFRHPKPADLDLGAVTPAERPG